MGSRSTSVLVLIVGIVLLSAAMAGGARTGIVDGTSAPGTAAVARADHATEATASLVATAATVAATTSVQSAPLVDADPFKNSERKVPNGPDPIHNRRARWGDAPARRVM